MRRLEIKSETGPRQRPSTIEGPEGKPHDGRRLFTAQTGVIAKPDDLREFKVDPSEAGDAAVEFPNHTGFGMSGDLFRIDGDAQTPSTSSLAVPGTCVVDQDAAHHPGRTVEEVTAIPPVHPSCRAGESQPGLVNDRGRSEGVVGTLPPKTLRGDALQLGIDALQRHVAGFPTERPDLTQRVFGWVVLHGGCFRRADRMSVRHLVRRPMRMLDECPCTPNHVIRTGSCRDSGSKSLKSSPGAPRERILAAP